MKVFVSWSGDQSQKVAGVVAEHLKLMLNAVEVFISVSDIEKGAKWQHELSVQLAGSDYGLFVLTPDNLTSQWMAFEAGALTKQLHGRAATLLFGVGKGTVPHPMAMFQQTSFEENDFKRLLGDINEKCDIKRSPDEMGKLHEKFWPELYGLVDVILADGGTPVPSPPSPTEQMLQEALTLLRQQNTQLSALTRSSAPSPEAPALRLPKDARKESYIRDLLQTLSNIDISSSHVQNSQSGSDSGQKSDETQ